MTLPTTPAPSEEIEGLLRNYVRAIRGHMIASDTTNPIDPYIAVARKAMEAAETVLRTHYTALLADRERLNDLLDAKQQEIDGLYAELSSSVSARDFEIAQLKQQFAARVPHE